MAKVCKGVFYFDKISGEKIIPQGTCLVRFDLRKNRLNAVIKYLSRLRCSAGDSKIHIKNPVTNSIRKRARSKIITKF